MRHREPTLHLVCGLPGSGKSTLARKLETTAGGVRFTPDDWLFQLGSDGQDEKMRQTVESIQWDLGQKLLSQGVDVILEFGFWSRLERVAFKQIALRLGAWTKLHYLEVPLEELRARISKRNMDRAPSTFFVDPTKLEDWMLVFEKPTPDELGDF